MWLSFLHFGLHDSLHRIVRVHCLQWLMWEKVRQIDVESPEDYLEDCLQVPGGFTCK